ncbi:hopanoid-associated phosphorylase [Methylocella silvestris BL2]|uniref:Hopanoid-associated phosphorylase n=1 Tax=Methylocella silvestris (strain DSM 15510 / CIP 108128 / LMG 27833 / NCIMB 13906 / BL2) TaxID=395965 RepID=B8EQD8_METSB|nr:hopanoid-associated phosphorylase [Methylocella silvestris]ACK52151.1 hopanoid-associated phosphorylase [Methylocella silvestris BL2]
MVLSCADRRRAHGSGRIIAVTGLKAEAKIAAGQNVHVISGGGDGARLRRDIEAAAPGARAIISFGVAGGLAPGLQRGSLFVARKIIAADGALFDADPDWSLALGAALGAALADFAGVDEAVAAVHAKRALHLRTGAHLVDMESHIAADVATRLGIPFAAVRAVADPAERQLPHAALVAMRPDGGLALGALTRSLARDPRQILQLIHTARDARAAFQSLLRGRKMLALGFALPDLVELVLNMPAEDELGGPLPV